MNAYDFYSFVINIGGKRDAKKLGMIKESGWYTDNVRSHKSWVHYGRKSYPKWTYTATVGYLDAPVSRDAVDAKQAELESKYGRTVYVRYHVVD